MFCINSFYVYLRTAFQRCIFPFEQHTVDISKSVKNKDNDNSYQYRLAKVNEGEACKK